MKSTTKNLDKCQVELTVALDAEEMKAIVKEVEKVFVREAKLPGFRPGKVPLELIRKEFAAKGPECLPTMLQYRTFVDENSLYNTPPTWGIYIFGETMKWVKKMGKENLFKLNAEKAGKIYDVIDSTEFYRGTAKKEFRSNMNITWRLPTEELEAQFIAEAKKLGMGSLKGHRSVGGIRASIYNAFPMEGVDALVSFMKDFEKKNG